MTSSVEPDVTPVVELRDGRGRRTSAAALMERFGLPVIFLVVVAYFALRLPGIYLSGSNLRAILVSQAVPAVAALALLVPLIAGRFDISVGAVVGLTSCLAAGAMSNNDQPLPVAIAVGVGAGALIGLANGVLVAFLGINSLICTIGISTVISGLVFAYTGGVPISTGLSPVLTGLGTHNLVGIPSLFLLMVLIALGTWFLLRKTTYGRHLSAIGSNETAALLTGIPVKATVCAAFVASGALAGVAGILQVAGQGNGNPQVGGIPFLLPALAAVFLGATTLFPGTYNVPGTVLGLYFVSAAVSGLTLSGVQPWITDLFNGAAVVVAVGLAAQFRRRRSGTAALGG
jgi:ribose transport system permease protein